MKGPLRAVFSSPMQPHEERYQLGYERYQRKEHLVPVGCPFTQGEKITGGLGNLDSNRMSLSPIRPASKGVSSTHLTAPSGVERSCGDWNG